jgi:hypothetical protein
MIGRPPYWTHPNKIDLTIPIQERARTFFEKRRANFLAQIERQKEIRRLRAKSLRVQKPIKTPPVALPTTVSNVIDFSSSRAKLRPDTDEEPNPCIKCSIFRPKHRGPEVFYFAVVPQVGGEIILEGISRPYILRSVTHRATKPGSVFRPIIELHLCALWRKER